MTQFILTHRHAGIKTEAERHLSRAAVANALDLLGKRAKIVSDRAPADALRRRITVIDVKPEHIEAIRAKLSPYALIEPMVRRRLHHKVPTFLRHSTVLDARVLTKKGNRFSATITGDGQPLAGIEVMLYLSNGSTSPQTATVTTDASGTLSFAVPTGSRVVAIEPIPYAGNWIMVSEAPQDGVTVNCLPITGADPNGLGWWHRVSGIGNNSLTRGAGVTVGVIDTGCGPHPNLQHVQLVGAFVDNAFQAGAAAAVDSAEHGTHTTGIIGARPNQPGEYAGLAPGCTLLHARVFKGEGVGDGPTPSDLIHAIDSLSQDYHCDLINMSLGGGPASEAEQDAIRTAAENGTLCICSAGNDATAIEYPAAYPECAAVSAVGQLGWAPAGTFSAGNRPQDPDKMGTDNLFLAAFSCFADGQDQALACCAPGVGIVSTVPAKGQNASPYMEMDGTSMASPAACGALAVILGSNKQYLTLPRDISRTKAALLALSQSCRSIGLATAYEGRGLPSA